MANLYQRFRASYRAFAQPNKDIVINKFNEAFAWVVGGGYSQYESNRKNYIEKGYNINPLVYSVVNQQAVKASSIPFCIKKVNDNTSNTKLKRLIKSTNYSFTPQQFVKFKSLELKAMDSEDLPLPLERPNVSQSWAEFHSLYKTFIKTTGNAYIYMLCPESGPNEGRPLALYLLPSHLMEIVLKPNTSTLSTEDPVDYYILTQGANYIKFNASKVVHIKYSNPNYSDSGEHLYGLSPLRSALKNIESSNSSLDLNIKTLKSGGAFGLIHAKGTPLREEQAKSLKERLLEMDASPENLSKIAGISAEIGFTRLSLTSDELKPFDYLEFDSKMIHNVLGWPYDDGNRGDYGGTINELRKMRITDNIIPDNNLLKEAFDSKILPRFKGYEGAVIVYDYMELPEMQTDVKELSEWLNNALDRGVITRNEYRTAIRYSLSDNKDLDRFTVQNDILSLDEALDNGFE